MSEQNTPVIVVETAPKLPPSPDVAVKPGVSTSEFKFQSAAAIAAFVPILQSVFTKQGDTTVEVICITVGVCVFNIGRVVEKVMAQRRAP